MYYICRFLEVCIGRCKGYSKGIRVSWVFTVILDILLGKLFCAKFCRSRHEVIAFNFEDIFRFIHFWIWIENVFKQIPKYLSYFRVVQYILVKEVSYLKVVLILIKNYNPNRSWQKICSPTDMENGLQSWLVFQHCW